MGWTPPGFLSASSGQLASCGVGVSINQKESEMNATCLLPMVGVDLSKNVFELAVADSQWRVVSERGSRVRSSSAGLPIVKWA